MKKLIALTAVACAGSLAASAAPAAAADLVYKASNYGGGSHGLWVNDFRSGADRYFSYQNDVYLKIDSIAGTGTLTGTAINPLGEIAKINLSFSGWLETTAGSGLMYKREGGAVYNEVTDMNDVDFFSAGSGTITLGGEVFNIGSDAFRSNTLFQYGMGANAKRANELGGSAWLNIDGRSGHWDMNFRIAAVPEPGTWMMMLLGFAAIGAAMRAQPRKTRLRVSYS